MVTLIILFYGARVLLSYIDLFLKKQKTKTKKPTTNIQQVTDGNTPNLVLQKILRYFLRLPPLKKILQLQDRISFCIEHTIKNHSSASDWWGNAKFSFKDSTRTSSKNFTTQ